MYDFILYPKNETSYLFNYRSPPFEYVPINKKMTLCRIKLKQNNLRETVNCYFWNSLTLYALNNSFKNDIVFFIMETYGKHFLHVLSRNIHKLMRNNCSNGNARIKLKRYSHISDLSNKLHYMYVDDMICNDFVCNLNPDLMCFQEYESGNILLAFNSRHSFDSFICTNGFYGKNDVEHVHFLDIDLNLGLNVIQFFPEDVNEQQVQKKYLSEKELQFLYKNNKHMLGVFNKVSSNSILS